MGTKEPNAAPTLRSRPVFVIGIPSFLEIRDLKAEIPRNLFNENPPVFILLGPPSCRVFPGCLLPEALYFLSDKKGDFEDNHQLGGCQP
jgi:hypothetical protein